MYIHIDWTAASFEEAQEIGEELLKRKWVACVNILPHVYSLYVWEGKLEKGEEVRVCLKTKECWFDPICEFIVKESSYDIPEVAKIAIDGGNPPYVDWVDEATRL